MSDLKEFISLSDIKKSKIYKELSCSLPQALILKELCKNMLDGINSVNVFALLSKLFKKSKYEYLEHLQDIKTLLDLGLVIHPYTMFKSENKHKQSLLMLLQSDVALSDSFIYFIEGIKDVKLDKTQAYEDYLEYLKDEFMKIELYQKLNLSNNAFNKKLKDEIQNLTKHIQNRLKKSKFNNILAQIFKEHSLNEKEALIFTALLKEEYSLDSENSSNRELNSLLNLISANEFEKLENKALLSEGSKLMERNLIDYDEYLTNFGDFSKSFYISDEFLQRIINSKQASKNKKLELQSIIKEQDIFEVIEPSTDINDVIMPNSTKELLENILKQQDKKVLQRLSEWGIKTSKNIEAKIIFYGPAGTGKTMSALSMAKSMKKSVLSFDCSKILSKFVGESEQNVRKIFDTYKKISSSCKHSPILLLNEADQFLSTRIESSGGSDKMHNQMQNIFLEQIERFSGVLIATTNFLESLDSAFSRRFDYKIEFKKPNFEEREQIWQRALPKKAKFDSKFSVQELAMYELSGAQIIMVIKNTALKAAISKDGIFKMDDFLESIKKELDSSFDKVKKVGFANA